MARIDNMHSLWTKSQKTGIATNNALILVNGILQAPGSNGDFTLEDCGIWNHNNMDWCC